MKKYTSQIRDIFTLKTKYPIVINTKKEQFHLIFMAFGMMLITILFGFLTDIHSHPSYMFLMTNAIFALIYITYLISQERMKMKKTNMKYSLFWGILPNLWSVSGPYVISQTLMILIFSTLFNWIVILIAILSMIALVLTTFLVNGLPNISFWRFFKSAILISILLYLITSLFEGMFFSLGYALSFSLVVCLDVLRSKIHHLPTTHRYYVEMIKFRSLPIFLLTWILIAFYSFLIGNLLTDPTIFRLYPIKSTPNIVNTFTRDFAPFDLYFELPDGRILADSHDEIAILDADMNIMFHFFGNYRLVQTNPYLLKEYRWDTNETLYWIINEVTGELRTPENMHLYEERQGFQLIETPVSVIYLFESPYYGYAFFDVYQGDSVVRHEFDSEDDQYVYADDCHALVYVDGKYNYLGCIGSRYAVINEHMHPTTINYSKGRFLIEHNVEGIALYAIAYVDNLDDLQDIESLGNRMVQYTFDEKTLWMGNASRNNIGCRVRALDIQRIHPNRGITETVTICSNRVYLLHGQIFIQKDPDGQASTTFDVVDENDMNRYVIRVQQGLGTWIFLPMFILSFFSTCSIQFKRIPYLNHPGLFQDMYSEKD
jgi:hypothetical protein